MITAQEKNDFAIINHTLYELETTKVQSTCNMHILLVDVHTQTHKKERILTCADILTGTTTKA